MTSTNPGENATGPVGRSYICEEYELRITERCLQQDLGMAKEASFEEALHHPIVGAFCNKRNTSSGDGKTVGPAAGADTIYRLAHQRHRGATWYDESSGVVWLCAYRYHESGAADDAFPYFRELMDKGQLRPCETDQETLRSDRVDRLVQALPEAARQLLADARECPRQEVRMAVGGFGVGVVIQVVETIEETFVAIVGSRSFREVVAVLASFYDADIGEWTPEVRLPTRELDISRFECCWSIMHEEGE